MVVDLHFKVQRCFTKLEDLIGICVQIVYLHHPSYITFADFLCSDNRLEEFIQLIYLFLLVTLFALLCLLSSSLTQKPRKL